MSFLTELSSFFVSFSLAVSTCPARFNLSFVIRRRNNKAGSSSLPSSSDTLSSLSLLSKSTISHSSLSSLYSSSSNRPTVDLEPQRPHVKRRPLRLPKFNTPSAPSLNHPFPFPTTPFSAPFHVTAFILGPVRNLTFFFLPSSNIPIPPSC